MKTLKRGILISIEGIDGSGKSTLTKNLTHLLGLHYAPVLQTKEPGGTELGSMLRTILQTQPVPLCNKAEYLLFAADRAQHFHQLIIPALARKNIIISDRMADSSVTYQGYARGLDIPTIQMINAWAMNGIEPDVTIYVRIQPEQALNRLRIRNQTLTAFEQEKTDFYLKLVHGFDTIFTQRTNVITVDGTQNQDIVTQDAYKAVQAWILKNNLLNS